MLGLIRADMVATSPTTWGNSHRSRPGSRLPPSPVRIHRKQRKGIFDGKDSTKSSGRRLRCRVDVRRLPKLGPHDRYARSGGISRLGEPRINMG